jgi:hypothetical protein
MIESLPTKMKSKTSNQGKLKINKVERVLKVEACLKRKKANQEKTEEVAEHYEQAIRIMPTPAFPFCSTGFPMLNIDSLRGNCRDNIEPIRGPAFGRRLRRKLEVTVPNP